MEDSEAVRAGFPDEWQTAKQALRVSLEQMPTLKDLLSLDKPAMGAVYKAAYDALVLENFAEAENLFTALLIFDPGDRDFQVGLAASLEAQDKFEPALAVYAMAACRDESAAVCFRMGKCFLGLADKVRAALMFEQAQQVKIKGFSDARERAYVEKAGQMAQLLKS